LGLRERLRDFMYWCPQPPDRLPAKLKHYSMPIAAVLTATIIISASFFIFSSSMIPRTALLLPLLTKQSTWSRQTVSTDDSFSTICMALDFENDPHIVYDGANGMLYYASWTGSSWTIKAVILGGNPIQLLFDSQNNPHILYQGADGVTYIASWDGSDWSFLALPSGFGYSLALDSNDNPHIAYRNNLPVSEYPTGVTSDICMLNYASWNGSGWNIQTVDSPISNTDNIYLALDKQNTPHIMYGYDTYVSPSIFSLITVKLAVWNGLSARV